MTVSYPAPSAVWAGGVHDGTVSLPRQIQQLAILPNLLGPYVVPGDIPCTGGSGVILLNSLPNVRRERSAAG